MRFKAWTVLKTGHLAKCICLVRVYMNSRVHVPIVAGRVRVGERANRSRLRNTWENNPRLRRLATSGTMPVKMLVHC